MPSAPQREGYTFAGWFVKDNGGEEFDFATPITGNISLYAKWVKNSSTGSKTDIPTQS